jgi:glutamate/tyrosine decarboxylase-like PLP-dependent enzyme
MTKEQRKENREANAKARAEWKERKEESKRRKIAKYGTAQPWLKLAKTVRDSDPETITGTVRDLPGLVKQVPEMIPGRTGHFTITKSAYIWNVEIYFVPDDKREYPILVKWWTIPYYTIPAIELPIAAE